jgi:Cd2+/Zn2+-exporting ATPase
MKKVFEFENLGCAHCAAKIEERINRLPEVSEATISFPMKKLYVETEEEHILSSLQKICSSIEPDVLLHEHTKGHHHEEHHHDHEEHHHHHHDHDGHCDCGCEDHHHEHEEHHHHHHDHDGHCDCGCEDHHHEHEEHHHHHHEHDHGEIAATKTSAPGTPEIFLVENLGCAHCAGKMEEQIGQLPGVEAANLTYATKQLRVWAPDAKALLHRFRICTSIEPQVEVDLRPTKHSKPQTETKAKKMDEDTKISHRYFSRCCSFYCRKCAERLFPFIRKCLFLFVSYLVLGIVSYGPPCEISQEVRYLTKTS